ncbi:MAG: DUF4347 domain-containing protein [Leptolyngbyaceae cyanobacterium SM2_5_2]|nr:DUF4347 domain-containing protein [Leptolyngbyaceae cyanobacterium SM2_5_2]
MFDTTDTALSTGLVFVDSSVGDYTGLIESIASKLPAHQTNIYTLDALANGVQQISQTLALYGEGAVSSIHVFSHGDVGQLQLGNMALNSHSLSGYQDDLLGWQSALTADADLLFYGCNVAQGAVGRNFIHQLSTLIRADVAASDDVTGNQAFGGDDWLLEYQTGAIETQSFTGDAGLKTTLGRLSFTSNKLLFEDIGLPTNNSLSIETTASHLIITDTSSLLAGTGITDLDGSSNSVTLAWSALTGMQSFEINGGLGEDSVTLKSNLFLNGANLDVIAEAITVQNNVILSTRQVAAGADHATANSTGNSGTIRLGSDSFGEVVKTITIGTGANLLTHAEAGSSYQAGDIQLYANYIAAAAAENLSPINWVTKTTTINIGTNAILKANSIDIKAQSEDKTLGDLLGANSLIDSFIIEPLQERLAEALALPVKFLVRKSEALVTVGSGAKLIGADDVTVDAVATTQSKGQAKGSYVSIGYVQANSTAKVNVLGGAIIEAGGNVSIGSEGKAEAAIATETEGTKSSSFGISLAVNHTDIVSHVTVAQGASIVAGKNANVMAYGNNSAEAEAASKTGNSGKASFAFGITLTDTDIKADVDGAITAHATAPAVAEGDDEDKPEPVTGIGIIAKLKTSDSAVAATERSDGAEPSGPDAQL